MSVEAEVNKESRHSRSIVSVVTHTASATWFTCVPSRGVISQVTHIPATRALSSTRTLHIDHIVTRNTVKWTGLLQAWRQSNILCWIPETLSR